MLRIQHDLVMSLYQPEVSLNNSDYFRLYKFSRQTAIKFCGLSFVERKTNVTLLNFLHDKNRQKVTKVCDKMSGAQQPIIAKKQMMMTKLMKPVMDRVKRPSFGLSYLRTLK